MGFNPNVRMILEYIIQRKMVKFRRNMAVSAAATVPPPFLLSSTMSIPINLIIPKKNLVKVATSTYRQVPITTRRPPPPPPPTKKKKI